MPDASEQALENISDLLSQMLEARKKILEEQKNTTRAISSLEELLAKIATGLTTYKMFSR